MTANSVAAASPGRSSGSVTRRKTRDGRAPRLAAARSSAGSRLATETPTERMTNGSTRIAWTAISTQRLASRPSPAARSRKPRPAATPGTITGDRSAAAQTARAATRCRTSASAAAVPIGSASSVAAAVTIRLFTAARWNCGYVSAFSYQRSDSPCGGKAMIAVGLKETTITTRLGTVRNASRSTTTATPVARAAAGGPRAEAGRRALEGGIDVGQRGGEDEDHRRHREVHQPDEHARGLEEQPHGPGHQRAAEHEHPGVRAHDGAREERRQRESEQ